MRVRVMVVVLAVCAVVVGGCGSSGSSKSGSKSASGGVQLTGEPAAMKAVCVRLNNALASATAASNTIESHSSDQSAQAELTSSTNTVMAAWVELKQHATTAGAKSAAATGERYALKQQQAAAQVAAGSGVAQGSFLDALHGMLPSLTAICG